MDETAEKPLPASKQLLVHFCLYSPLGCCPYSSFPAFEETMF